MITPFPPIMELSFLLSEIDSSKDALDGKIDFNSKTIILLHKRVKTILVRGFVLIAKDHKFSFLVCTSRVENINNWNSHPSSPWDTVFCVIVVSADKKEKQIV